MYNIELRPHLIRVCFSKLSDKLQVLKVVDFYSNEPRCVISRITLIKNINGVYWYNDITPYRRGVLLGLLARLRDESIRGGAESTHIMDGSLINYDAIVEIQTLNRDNPTPNLMTDDAFKAHLIRELLGML
jgi:hypothetical protein